MKQWEVQWTLYQQRLAGIKLSASRYRGPSEHDECVRDIKFLLDEIGRLTHMMELKQAPPAGQRWTREKPTEKGFYWWRSEATKAGVIEVQIIDGEAQYGCGGPRVWFPVRQIGGEFQGPLTPNEATE